MAISAFVKVEDVQLHAKTLDLSSSGLSVLMFRSLPPGTSCEIELRWMSNRHSEFIQARATVLHASLAAEGGFRVGMRFDHMDQESRAMLSMISV